MKIVINTILCGFALATLSSCATKVTKGKDAPKGKPAATLTYNGGSAAYWVSAGGGTGKLNYNGRHYPFTATSLGTGGSGERVPLQSATYTISSNFRTSPVNTPECVAVTHSLEASSTPSSLTRRMSSSTSKPTPSVSKLLPEQSPS